MSYFGKLEYAIIDRNIGAAASVTGYDVDYLFDIFDEHIDDGVEWNEALEDTVTVALELDYDDVIPPIVCSGFWERYELFRKAGGLDAGNMTLNELHAELMM